MYIGLQAAAREVGVRDHTPAVLVDEALQGDSMHQKQQIACNLITAKVLEQLEQP